MQGVSSGRMAQARKRTFAAEIEEDQAVASAWVCTPALSSSCTHRICIQGPNSSTHTKYILD